MPPPCLLKAPGLAPHVCPLPSVPTLSAEIPLETLIKINATAGAGPACRGQGRAGESMQASTWVKDTCTHQGQGGQVPGETGMKSKTWKCREDRQRPMAQLCRTGAQQMENRCAEQVGNFREWVGWKGPWWVFRSSPARVHQCPAWARNSVCSLLPSLLPVGAQARPGGQPSHRKWSLSQEDLKHKQFSLW